MATEEQTAANSRSRLRPLLWIVPGAVVAAAILVLLARLIYVLPATADFLRDFPGTSALPGWSPRGFPLWLAIQHFLSGAFLLFIVLSGWQIRRARTSGARPREFWIRDNDRLVRTPNPPVRITLTSWWHLTLDALWVLNGIVFWVLLFATGQWVRIVPTRWDVIPNALSAALQYASLNWPHTDGWVQYNALQLLTYFVTVFIAAPLAVLTGLRLAPGLAVRWRPFEKAFPLTLARIVHVATMVWFVAFAVTHIALELLTAPLSNLEAMYALRHDDGWTGFVVFALSLVVIAVAWWLLRGPRRDAIARVTGTVKRR